MDIHLNTFRLLLENQLSSKLNSHNNSFLNSSNEFQALFEQIMSNELKEMKIIPAHVALKHLEMKNHFSDFNMGSIPNSDWNTSERAAAYEEYIMDSARKYDVEPALIKAVIHTESSYRSDAISHAGAKGLMQLMDATAKSVGVEDAFNPQQNIEGGTQFLSYLLRRYEGNESVALAAYNAGPGRIDRLGIRTNADLFAKLTELPEETQNYIQKVERFKAIYSI